MNKGFELIRYLDESVYLKLFGEGFPLHLQGLPDCSCSRDLGGFHMFVDVFDFMGFRPLQEQPDNQEHSASVFCFVLQFSGLAAEAPGTSAKPRELAARQHVPSFLAKVWKTWKQQTSVWAPAGTLAHLETLENPVAGRVVGLGPKFEDHGVHVVRP